MSHTRVLESECIRYWIQYNPHTANRDVPNKSTGRSLHCQVENHMRTKFATPILYAIDNFKNYDIFSTYTKPLIISFVYFLEFFGHLHSF